MDKQFLKSRIIELIDSFIVNLVTKEAFTEWTTEQKLRLIITDSVQAINFIIILEEEFDVEIDDDDISLEFFESIDTVTNAVLNAAKNNTGNE